MAYKLIFQSEAILDIQQAFLWYEKQQVGLGELFIEEVEDACQRLSLSPAFYSFVTVDFRKIKLQRFPYLVIYEIEGETIFIFQVKHTRKKPKY